jgi:hypothetical protein
VSERDARAIVNSRLAEVGLSADRFVTCQRGQKKCLDHDNRQSEPPTQNYGIYTTAADRLVVLDIDDYKEGGDSSGVAALAKLPPTLETKSPHGGTHRFYAVEATDDGRLPAAVLKEEFGAANPIPSFGEVIVKNKYVVGAGSQLTRCKKDWCEDCETEEGGRYVVQADRSVAEITPEQLVEALRSDPDLSHRDDESEDLTEYEGAGSSSSVSSADASDIEYDDELSREQVEEALEHVDNRLHYDDWIRVGFAVYDWDDGATGKQVFESWSRQSPKWIASEGQPHIDDIWSGSPNGDVSIGTLVHHAKQGGWEPPRGRPKTHVDGDLVTAEAAAARLEDLLDRYATDADDEIPEERQEEIGRLIGAVTEEDYGALRDRAQAVFDTSGEVLDEHRRLIAHRLDDGPVLVENVSTYYHSAPPLSRREICNFEIEVESFLTVPGEPEQAEVRVRHGDEEFEKFVGGELFKERQRFEDDLASERLGMIFDPRGHPTQSVLDQLNMYVESRDAPRRRGTHHMGLHDGEFVTPAGSLTEEGWTDDPEYVYLDRDLGIERNVSLPADSAAFDADDVARIVEDLPYTRDVSRFLPVLGWFYAAPFRPHIEDQEQEKSFNLLNVTGDTGSGKTTTLRYLWRCFGMAGEPFDARDTWFVLLSTFAATNSIPVWHDEYKPSDMTKREVDRFHDALRKTATASTAQRGNADKSTTEYHLRAPAVVSGEQQIQPPAERRRSVMVNFHTSVTQEGTGTRRRFKQLVGSGIVEGGELLLPDDAPDPTNHALAYYRFVAAQSGSDFREAWLDARERVWEVHTARSRDRLGASDREQLELAVENDWIVFTFDDDFLSLVESEGLENAGLIYVQQAGRQIGDVVKAIDGHLESRSESDRSIHYL